MWHAYTWVLENSRLYERKVAAIWFEPTMSWLVDHVLTFNLWTSGRIWSSSLCYENDEHVPEVYQENEEIITKSCSYNELEMDRLTVGLVLHEYIFPRNVCNFIF